MDSTEKTENTEGTENQEEREGDEEKLGTQCTVETVGPCKRRIKAEVPSSKVTDILDRNYREIISTFQIPGFRRGRVPRRLIEKRLGDKIEEGVKESLLEDSFQEVVEENGLRIIGKPKFDNVGFTKGEPFTYEVEVEVRPEFELGTYKGIEVKDVGDDEAPPVTDEGIDAQIQELRKRRAELVVIDPGAATPGDYYIGNYTLELDGIQVHAKEEVGFQPESGIVDGFQIPDLAEKVASAGSSSVFSAAVKVPEDYSAEVLRGKDVKLEFDIEVIKRLQIPEVNDEFAGHFEASSVTDLRDRIRRALEAHRAVHVKEILEQRVLEKISEGVQFDLPEGFLEDQAKLHRLKLELSLIQSGVPREIIDTELKKVDEGGTEDLRKEAKNLFILEKIAELEKIYATEDEVERQVFLLAQDQSRPFDDVMDELKESGRIETIRSEIRHAKVRRLLQEKARILKEGEPPPAEAQGESPPAGDQGDRENQVDPDRQPDLEEHRDRENPPIENMDEAKPPVNPQPSLGE